jgi:hypothetical protein
VRQSVIFKQRILKEQKVKFICGMLTLALPVLFLLLMGLLFEAPLDIIFLFLFLVLPFVLAAFLGEIGNLEWYCVYKEKIEARNIYGIKNVVYFDKVEFVEEVSLVLIRGGDEKSFYIFNDGRKSNSNILGVKSYLNRKKYNLIVYKTNELEVFLKKRFNIV